ncbi:MAG: DUF429 domain-containing protein [Chloroflexota bacterium]|nr:DUF429 domain-containing protein [Chloroflexota bacterium]
MRTVGIDFASQPKNTALCEIVWDGSSATVVQVASPVTDELIRELVAGPPSRVFGVDIPFGWPTHFVQFVTAHMARVTPPPGVSSTQKRLRATDEFVWEVFRRQPLSVSTDRIGIPAMRWASLMQEFGVVNRAGDGWFYEVYPAAARMSWGLPPKDDAAALDLLMAECPLFFAAAELPHALLRSDHAFDALICALATRAAALGLTYPPPADVQDLAEVEGWIHAPRPGTLDQLISAEID